MERHDIVSDSGNTLAHTDPTIHLSVYYRLYSEEGAISSKASFSADWSLGRIPTLSITPPHTIDSIKRSIARGENDPTLTQAVIYAELSSDSPMEGKRFSMYESSGPGLTLSTPLAIVKQLTRVNRPAKMESAQVEAANTVELPAPIAFRQKLKATSSWCKHCSCPTDQDADLEGNFSDPATLNADWPQFEKGTIMYTTGPLGYEELDGRDLYTFYIVPLTNSIILRVGLQSIQS